LKARPIGFSFRARLLRAGAAGREGTWMSVWLKPSRMAVLCAAFGVAQTMAATSSRVDILPDDPAGSPAAPARSRRARKLNPMGLAFNPLPA